MSEIIDRRISFNAGEISPWLDPRIDLDKYQMGCRQMENIRGSIYGGAIKRAGTQYIGAALVDSTPVRLIPWLGGDGTDYVLEFSNLKLRIWNADTLALVESAPGTPLEVTTVFTAAQLEQIQHAQQNDVMYFAHPNHSPQVLVKTASTWMIGNAKFDWPATLGPNTTRIQVFPRINVYVHTWSGTTTYTSGQHVLSGGKVYKATSAGSNLNRTPPNATYWTDNTWSNAKAYTAGDVILYSGSYYQAITTHTAATGSEPGTEKGEAYYAKGTRINATGPGTPVAYNSSIVYTIGQQVVYNDKIYTRTSYLSIFGNEIKGTAPTGDYFSESVWTYTGPIATPAANASVAVGESIVLEASEALFQSGHVGTTWIIAHQRENPKSTMDIRTATVGATSDPIYVLGAFSLSLTQNVADTSGMDLQIIVEQSTDLVEWQTYAGVTASASNAQQVISGNMEDPVFMRAKLISKIGIDTALTFEIVPDSSTQYGLATITAFISSTEVQATVVTPIYRPWPTKRWEEPAFSGVRGFPRAVTLHDGRLWFGGTEHRPTTVWGSTVDAYWDFRQGADDDRSLEYMLATDESSRVEWLVSQDLLVIGTSSSEWVLGQRPGDDEIKLRRNTSFGSAAVQARAISDSVVFIQKSRRKIREFAWSFERDGYLANDLSMLAEHLGDAGMRQIAIQRNPEAVVWIITERGDLLALTYERGQNVAGWARYTTAGTFESICILPAEKEEDVVWVCVAREMDGSTVRYIERIAPDQIRALKNGETSDLTFSDCAITVEPTGSATGDAVVSGLSVSIPTLGYDGEVLMRPSYAADGGLYTLAAELPKASGTVGTGESAIYIEAASGGTGGNSITVNIVSPSETAFGIGVVGNAITITLDTRTVWTARNINSGWYAITSSADGTKLAAVTNGGRIYTSADSGVTWTARESNRNWYAIASSADGTKLAAVVIGGQIYTSADSGVTWTARESSRGWNAIVSSADGTKLAAVTTGGQIYTSADSGATWTARESSRNWTGIASSADGTKLAAVTNGGQIYTSADSGVTWTARESNRVWRSIASSADGTKLAAVVVNGQIYTSADSGVTWTARESSRGWNAIVSSSDGTKLAAVVTGGRIYTSADSGVTWTARESNRNWYGIASSADGTKLAAVVAGGQIYTFDVPQRLTAAALAALINDNASASALIVASAGGNGIPIAAGPVTLTGGSDTPRWRLTAAGKVWLAASTETYPWDIDPGDWTPPSLADGKPGIMAAESTITGLSHLEGMEVVILADGAVHRSLWVEGGEITLDYACTTAVVGLPYTATLEPTWLETPQVAGFSKAGKKRIHRIITETWKTAGLEISVDNGVTWKPMETRAVSDLMDSNRPLITGVREEFVNGSTSRQISCILRSADPLPMLLQSLHIRYQIDAK